MSKVRLTDIEGNHYVVNSDEILYLRDSHPFDDLARGGTPCTLVMMPGDLTITIQGTLDQTIEKLRWRV